MSAQPRIALLIDADNMDSQVLHTIMPELLRRGAVPVRLAFANWRKKARKDWDEIARLYALRGIQQFDPVSGKNATDMSLTLEAMDLLHRGVCDTFAIVSSDGDFTPLAIRLREAGVKVLGFGRRKHAEAFARACDAFMVVEEPAPTAELAPPAEPEPPQPADAKAATSPQNAGQKLWPAEFKAHVIGKVQQWFREAYEELPKKDKDFVLISQASQYISKNHPNYDLKKLGYSRPSTFLKAFDQVFELSEGNLAYRLRA